MREFKDPEGCFLAVIAMFDVYPMDILNYGSEK
jgi:hypothetical protein